jgi:hypothetical protein
VARAETLANVTRGLEVNDRKNNTTGSAVAQERFGISREGCKQQQGRQNSWKWIDNRDTCNRWDAYYSRYTSIARAGTPETSETLAAERASSVGRMKATEKILATERILGTSTAIRTRAAELTTTRESWNIAGHQNSWEHQ